ncbi:SDR family oxidoreductase [Sphingomonas sp. R-74633]|uniref:UDP-2-acetamido-2,6-beta-L-arabino-hexul-4-ose reductase n=1 Tax=Sphingomonas sp. R-74633 TaxID=2751188 RepID=UPI0015D42DDC|nr:SDR family oxidoreductase [Sphingomonas sp. R-74633]
MSTILVTGAGGFIGRNLCVRLAELGVHNVIRMGRSPDAAEIADAASRAEFVFHLAGVNRPQDPDEFATGNTGFTETLCEAFREAGNAAPFVYASTIQVAADHAYGTSKREAEDALLRLGEALGASIHIFRLPNVFGKWARPDYNSAVATFCHNIARGKPITIHDPVAPLQLVYIDDVVDAFLGLLANPPQCSGLREVEPIYRITVGEVADRIRGFRESRDTLTTPPVGTGLERALHSTYLSYLPPEDFSYSVPVYGREDPRGEFVEMLKTVDSGQFSYFIAHPGVTRGDHYHHTKAEKFLVIQGKAHFGFRHIVTGERHEVVTHGGEGLIVETIPGWTHNITNVGDDKLIVMLWANEIFDRARPDTISMKV